jgi:tetratricopeptide (TPR) repeat protein
MEWSMRSAERAPSATRRLPALFTLTALSALAPLVLAGCETIGNAFGPPEKPVSMRAPVTSGAPIAPARTAEQAPAPKPAAAAAPAPVQNAAVQPAAVAAPKAEAAQPAPPPAAPVDPAAQRAFDAAREALAAGRVAEAERGFTALTRSHPDLAGPYANLAVIQRRNGKNGEAIAGLEKAVQLSPRSAELYNQLGISYRQAGEMKKAQAAYDRAITLDPRHANAQLNLGILHDLYLNDPQRALAQYEAYLALVPTDEQVKKWVGELKIRLSRKDGGKKE